MMDYKHIRSHLTYTHRALTRKSLSIGFLGGSITENRVPHNWPEVVIRFFTHAYPDLKLTIENAAIGATGSDLGLIRVDRDIIRNQCDLVFIEYAVNDFWTPHLQRMDQMEGIIRRLKKYGSCDIVMVYTYLQDMYVDLIQNHLPEVVKGYELLAHHYQLNSVFAGLFAFNHVQEGLIRFDEWLPDGLHPQYRGSQIYGEAVIDMLKKSLLYDETQPVLPPPLSNTQWEFAHLIPLDSIDWKHPFYLKRSSTQSFIEYVLSTTAIGAKLTIPFEGRGIMLVFDFGKKSSEFRYSIDGQLWKDVTRDRPQWCGNSGWLRPIMLSDQLSLGNHQLEIEVIHGDSPTCEGNNFDLTHILVLV